MDQEDIPTLQYHVERIVKEASKPGGALGRQEFTMKKVRQSIAEALGLESTSLDDPKWKAMVKNMVQDALDALPSTSSPVKAKATKAVKQPKKASRTGSTPSISPPPPTKRKPTDEKSKVEVDVISIASTPSPPPKPAKLSKASTPVEVIEVASESEMSSVYDEPPKRGKGSKVAKKRKSDVTDIADDSDDDEKSKGKKRKAEPKKRRTSKVDDLPHDEARVVDLKRIIVACGVRKQWSKELTDCETPRSQISHLLRLLTSLGMKGTPTLGKAKILKEKRELAAEIDDVVAFEAERGISGGRSKRSAAGSRVVQVISDDEGDDQPKTKTAGQAIFDFLGHDASDSE